MKTSKSPRALLILALSLTAALASTSLVVYAAVAKSPAVNPASVHPVKGIDVIVQKSPGNTASRATKTDNDGAFTVDGLSSGQYNIRFQCRTCVWGDPHVDRVDITLTGVSEKNFKRSVSKQQVTDGVNFAAGLDAANRIIAGHVSSFSR